MSRYTVTAERTAHWWVLQAVEAPGAISQVKRLDQADVIREAIAFVTGEPEDDIEIDVRLVGPVGSERLEELVRLRSETEALVADLQQTSREVAVELVQEGLPYRDVATLMGVSHQRVGQLVAGAGRDA